MFDQRQSVAVGIVSPNGLLSWALPPYSSSSSAGADLHRPECAFWSLARYLRRMRCYLEWTEEMDS